MSRFALTLGLGLCLAAPAWAQDSGDTADTGSDSSGSEATHAASMAGESGGVALPCGCQSSGAGAAWLLVPALAVTRRRR